MSESMDTKAGASNKEQGYAEKGAKEPTRVAQAAISLLAAQVVQGGQGKGNSEILAPLRFFGFMTQNRFIPAIVLAAVAVGMISPIHAQSFYNLPLDIDRYCREKFGPDAFAHTIGNQDAYSWRCSVKETTGMNGGFGINLGTENGVNVQAGSQSSRVDRPVHVNDVCQWQYGQDFVAYLINQTSGGWKCQNSKVHGPRPR